MGRTIQEEVVDGFLNVFGTKNLKVTDLSIAPILPTTAQIIGLNAVQFIQKYPHPYVVNNQNLKIMRNNHTHDDNVDKKL